MSKHCGLKKTMCPGPVLGSCPFSRDDCSFHESSDAAGIVLGAAILPLRTMTKMVQNLIERAQDDDSPAGRSSTSSSSRSRDRADQRQS
jgi:hypothetical protein